MSTHVFAPPLVSRGPAEAARIGVLHLAELRLEHGGAVTDCEIAYELAGAHAAPVIVVLGGISASRHVTAHTRDPQDGWWQAVVGRGRGIDNTRYRVLSIDYLGGRGRSSGPHTHAHFPAVDTRDQARAIAAVLDHLGIARIRAFVGASYGGMVALAFAATFPARAVECLVIGAAHRPHPMATALRVVQREIVRTALRAGRAADGLALARALAVTTYRSAEEFAARFDHRAQPVGGRARFPVEDYLEHCGQRFAAVFPPECFLALSESIDLHDVAPEQIHAPVTLVGVQPDAVAPLWQIRELGDRLGSRANVIEVRSIYGHDAFLKEIEVINAICSRAFADVTGGAA